MTGIEISVLGVAVLVLAIGLFVMHGELRFQRKYRSTDWNRHWVRSQVEKARLSVAVSLEGDRMDMLEAAVDGLNARSEARGSVEVRLLMGGHLKTDEKAEALIRSAGAGNGRWKFDYHMSDLENLPQFVLVDNESLAYFEGQAQDFTSMTITISRSKTKTKLFVERFDSMWPHD